MSEDKRKKSVDSYVVRNLSVDIPDVAVAVAALVCDSIVQNSHLARCKGIEIEHGVEMGE